MKFLSYNCLIFYLCAYVSLAEGFGGLARAGSLNGLKSSKSPVQKKSLAGDTKQANTGGEYKASKGSKGFISAWGIISLIMLVIVGSVVIYYVSIFYPLVCAKRGKYDVMEMTSV